MWYPATITVPAEAEPATLQEAKEHLRVIERDGAGNDVPLEDDDLVSRLIAAAREHIEHYCGVRFASQTIEIRCDGFGDFSRLPEAPVASVESVTYADVSGATQTLSSDVYELRADGLEPAIVRKHGQQWPAVQPGSRIIVTAVVGYGTAPQVVRQAVLMLVDTWYEHREQIGQGLSELPGSVAVDALLCNHRRGV